MMAHPIHPARPLLRTGLRTGRPHAAQAYRDRPAGRPGQLRLHRRDRRLGFSLSHALPHARGDVSGLQRARHPTGGRAMRAPLIALLAGPVGRAGHGPARRPRGFDAAAWSDRQTGVDARRSARWPRHVRHAGHGHARAAGRARRPACGP
ncbi:hypothetical protein ACRAWD_20715 [Caulobacter segnis]